MAATAFCFDTLKTGGHFVCKFYQGAEDKALELTLKRFFEKVHRDKPDSSRSVCSETKLPRITDHADKDAGIEGSLLRGSAKKRAAWTPRCLQRWLIVELIYYRTIHD